MAVSQINESGTMIGSATHVSTGPDDPFPAGSRNVLLVPIMVLTPVKGASGHGSTGTSSLHAASALKVGQWEDAWLPGRANLVAGDFPDEDVVQAPRFDPPEQVTFILRRCSKLHGREKKY